MEINNVRKTDTVLKTVDDKYSKNYKTKEILKQLLVIVCKQI